MFIGLLMLIICIICIMVGWTTAKYFAGSYLLTATSAYGLRMNMLRATIPMGVVAMGVMAWVGIESLFYLCLYAGFVAAVYLIDYEDTFNKFDKNKGL